MGKKKMDTMFIMLDQNGDAYLFDSKTQLMGQLESETEFTIESIRVFEVARELSVKREHNLEEK